MKPQSKSPNVFNERRRVHRRVHLGIGLPLETGKCFVLLVGAGRFERPTPCAQGRCATRLRYAPTSEASLILNHLRYYRHHPGSPNRAKVAATVAKTPSVRLLDI